MYLSTSSSIISWVFLPSSRAFFRNISLTSGAIRQGFYTLELQSFHLYQPGGALLENSFRLFYLLLIFTA
jgi:hypothetical protein